MNTKHQQIGVYNHFLKKNINIDKNISLLIRSIWKRHLYTYNSCEDNQNKIWIEFDLKDGVKFFNIVNDYFTKYKYRFEHNIDYILEILPPFIHEKVNWTLSIRIHKKFYNQLIMALKSYNIY